jgi:stage IV sporulation protein FB
VARYEAPDSSDGMPIVSGARVAEINLGSIPVRIEFPFLLVAVLTGVRAGSVLLLLGWVIVVFVSILVHELGHALAARAYGEQVRILLHGMGGLTYRTGRNLGATQDIVVSLAGSITQIALLGLPALFLLRTDAIDSFTLRTIVLYIAWVSFGWAIINLLPLLPFDGGNIAVTILRRVNGIDAVRVVRLISVGVAVGVAVWAYHAVGPLTSLWVLFFGALNVVALARNGS